MMNKLTFKACILSCLFSVSTTSQAKLEELNDDALSEYTGQAFITIDQPASITEGDTTYKYTRINTGFSIDTVLNIDKLELGRYDDPRDITNSGADINMTDVALGTYFNPHDYFEVNSSGDIVYGSDGLPKPDPSKFPNDPDTGRQLTVADTGKPLPFHIEDPFIEFAFKEENGVQSIAGFRLGFGGAKGTFTTNIESLSGNLDVIIQDDAQSLGTQDTEGFFGKILEILGPVLLGNSPISTEAILQQGPNDPNPGQALDYRATHIGVETGDNFRVDAGDVGFLSWTAVDLAISLLAPADANASTTCTSNGLFGVCTGGNIDLHTEGCELIGIDTCFPLDKYQSLDIGNGEEARGAFLGIQTEEVPWRTDVFVSTDPSNPIAEGEYVEGIMRAGQGFYLNIPTGGINIDLKEAVNNGIPRQTTRYTDASLGLF